MTPSQFIIITMLIGLMAHLILKAAKVFGIWVLEQWAWSIFK